ncbi:MAG: amidohydrolase [Gemmatimonadetes bacterium]|nr:amidohydrolase [Gemmatimonadota bacterium]
MIVDVHTHLPTHRGEVPPDEVETATIHRSGTSVRFTNSLADYLEAMAGVDRAITFGLAPRPWAPEGELMKLKGWPADMNYNDVAAAVARESGGKIIPFMSVHPMDPKWEAEYDRCIGDLGCRGMKLGLNYQDCDPLSNEALKVFARLERDGLPVVFHMGTSPETDAPLEYAHPLKMDRAAILFPKLKMVLAHLAHPWHADCLAVVRKHPNVWADVSAQFYRPWSFWSGMRLFHEWGVLGKVLFATDWPVTVAQDNIDALRGLAKFARDCHLPVIPEQEIEGIINRDALEILGLE